jgi:hypothetical protein
MQQQAVEDNIEGTDPSQYLPEPKSIKALNKLPPHIRKQWLKAFKKEIMNLLNMKAVSKPKHYKGEKCIPVTVIYKTKLKADGMIDKLKIRVAMRGDLDDEAQEEDNGAPLATLRLFKIFLSNASKRRRRIYQSDYIGAYLQAFMDRIVYIIFPKEWAEYFPELAEWFGIPLLLEKSAYGIASAGRLWAETLFQWYVEFGFTQSKVEKSLFYYNHGDEWIVLLSYCDDTAYYCSSDTIRHKFEDAMCKRFECKLLGQLHWFLQARITQHTNFNITIDQSRYAASMCHRLLPQYDVISPSETDKIKYASPLPNNIIFTKADCSKNYLEVKELEDEFGMGYSVAIGCLLWILNTFPRLQFTIRKLAKFMQFPGRVHFKALIHTLHHVRCYHNNGLTYYHKIKDAPISQHLFLQNIIPDQSAFYAFSDSSWQDCPDTGRSTGGYYIFLQGGIVDAAMTFPVPVALSSAEAEYCTASLASAAINALAMLVNEMNDNDTDEPLLIPLILDNTAAIAMGDSFDDTKHNRHILRRYHYVRYMSEEERINLLWAPTKAQVADIATKCLDSKEDTYQLFITVGETKVEL